MFYQVVTSFAALKLRNLPATGALIFLARKNRLFMISRQDFDDYPWPWQEKQDFF